MPLANVIESDSQGVAQLFVTLYDSDGKIIDTNDPDRSVDSKYLPASKGGEGATIDPGSGMRVFLRAAAVTPHNIDGEGTGIQEGVTYVMDLPCELVPVAESASGEKYVDPDEPLRFFDSGTVRAQGGIYTKCDADGDALTDSNGTPLYEMRVSFENVEDQLDVSGECQYTATVSEHVTPGSHVGVTFVPGGTVGFDVTPTPAPVIEGQYSLTVSGGTWFDNNKFHWQAALTDNGDASAEGGLTAQYGQLEIESDEGMGFYVDANRFDELLAKTAYAYDAGIKDSITITYDDENATIETLTPTRSGATEAVYTNAEGNVRVRLTFSATDVTDNRLVSADGTSFITRVARLTIDDGQGGAARHARTLGINLPATSYDDWSGTSSSYKATARASSGNPSYLVLEATNSFGSAYGYFATPTMGLGNDGSHDLATYNNTSRISGNLETSTTGYTGNYYWVDYDPCRQSTLKDSYYPSTGSFLPGGELSLGYGAGYGRDSTSWSTFKNFALIGRYTNSGWVSLGEFPVGSLVYGSSTEELGDSSDVKLRKQLSEVFSGYDDMSQTVIIYRSQSPLDTGRYAYVVIDPDTVKTAKMDQENGWSEYMVGDKNYANDTSMWDANENAGSARAASWRIHIFNAPYTSVQAFFGMSQGTIGRADSNENFGQLSVMAGTGNGRIGSDAIQRGERTFDSSQSSEIAFRSTTMDGQWVDENTIMWKLTARVTDYWEDSWRTTTLFAQAPTSLATGSKVDRRSVAVNISGAGPELNGSKTSVDQTLTTTGIYAMKQDGTWEQVSDCASSDLIGDGRYYSYECAAMGKTSSDFGLGTTIEHSEGCDTWMLGAHRLDSPSCGNLANYVNADSGTVTLAFFSTIPAGQTVSERDLTCTAELVAGTGELSSYAKDSSSAWKAQTQYAVKLKGTAQMGTAGVSKYTDGVRETTDGQGRAVTETTWCLSPYATGQTGYRVDDTPMLPRDFYYGGYQGNLTVTDSMADTEVNASLGEGAENPAKHVHIMSMFDSGVNISVNGYGGGGGPIPSERLYQTTSDSSWLKWDDESGAWVKMGSKEKGGYWDPYRAGTYRCNYGGAFTLTVRYSGNMYDNVEGGSAPLEITLTTGRPYNECGFAAFQNASTPFVYTTAFCPEEYLESTGSSPAVGYQVTFKNSASTTSWGATGQSPTTSSTKKTFAASLSIKKSTSGVQPDYATGGIEANYEIDTTVGVTGTDYVSLDDFVSGFSDSGNLLNGSEAASYGADDADALSALASHMDVSNLVIVAKRTVAGKEDAQLVHANGGFTDGWKTSSVKMGEDSKPGSLFSLELRHDDGSQIEPQTTFEVTYRATLDMDGDDGGFRASNYYHGGTLKIANSAIAERDYQVSDGQASDAALFSAPDADGVVLTQEMGDQTVQVYDAEAVPGGEIDRDHLKLRVWPTTDVAGTYLMEPDLAKTPVKTWDEEGDSSWLFYEWTGSEGKNSPSVSVTDGVEFKLNDLYASRDDLTDQQKQELRARLAYIASKHVSVSNLKVYLTTTRPQTGDGTTNLTDADLVWSLDGQIHDAQGEKDGRTYTVTTSKGGVYTDPETGEVSVVTPSFTVTGTDLGFNRYLATTYDMHFDQEGFLKEAQEAGLLDDAGFATGTTEAPTWTMINKVKDQRGVEKSESSSEVAVDAATLGKSVVSADEKAGSAEWAIDAYTGKASDPSELKITDELTFTGDSEEVCAAAKAATSIADVRIALGDDTIWQDGSVTEAGRAAGWSDANFSVSVDGSKLDVVLANADGATPLAAGQRFRVTYKTTLDKDAYIAALVEAGASSVDATYTIENAAQLRIGSAVLDARADHGFAPTAPVKASKETIGNPNDGRDTQTVSFRATGEAGEVDRKDFTLTDTVTPTSQAAALASSLEVSALEVTLSLASGNASTYSGEDILAGRVPGVSLTTVDGESFSLDTPGQYGWKLTVASLPAGSTVAVDYDVHVDRDAYIAAGGELGSRLTLANALSVGTADGSAANASSSGSVSVKPDVTKKGVVASGTSEEGNPLVNWTFDVNLASIFDAAQLAQLKTANIRDSLNFMLRADLASVKVYDLASTVDGVTQGDELPSDAYEVTLDEATNTLVVSVKSPANHPNVRICVTTEVRGSLDGISNSVDLEVDGEKVGGSTVVIDKPLIAVTEYGTITSVPVPVWTPVAEKLVDGAVSSSLAGRFDFECVEVDESGSEVAGGYHAASTNDAEGQVTFEQIKYGGRDVVGTRWYQVREIPRDGDDATYLMDETVYTVKVAVARGAQGEGYLLSAEVIEPDASSEVVFRNTTRTPDVPTPPDNPDKPTPPDNPDKPTPPDNPDTPTPPDNPDVPTPPDNPDTPTPPDNPDVPTGPDTPEEPSSPDTPDIPESPDNPDIPDTPQGSEEPSETISAENGKSGQGMTLSSTGDASPVIGFTLLAISSCAACVIAISARRRLTEKR